MAESERSTTEKEPEVHVAETGGDGEEDSSEGREKFRPGWRFQGIFLCLCLLTLVVAFDATSLSVALPAISTTLNITALQAFWAGTSFLLTSTLSQPLLASLSHIYGRLPLTLVSLSLFSVGSICAAACLNFSALLAGRTVQGFGAGGLISLTEVIITDLVPLRERGTYYGYMAGTWAVGSVCGPLIGGGFAGMKSEGYAGWRLIFWFNLPIAGVAFLLLPWLLRLEKPMQGKSGMEKLRSVDWVGVVLLTGSTTAILIPVTWGGLQYPWTNYRTLLPLILGFMGFVGWVLYTCYTKHPNPLVQMAIFNNRTAAASYFGILIQGIILWSLVYYLPLYYEACHGYTPIQAGLAVLPETLTVAPVAFIVGLVITKVGTYRWSVWMGWAVTVLGLGLMWLLDEASKRAKWIGLNILPGLGVGMLFPGLEYATQAAAGQADVAHAAAMYNFIRAFGQGIGVAVGGAIFQDQFRKNLLRYPGFESVASAYVRDAATLVEVMKGMVGTEKLVLEEAYANSLKVVWAVMAGLAGLALLVSVMTKELGIDETLQSQQGLKKVGEDSEERGRVTTVR
ncbi:major facilitator superfamily domain-containing protein [Lophiotrema nucula]|uniref:Major facilitator superfamily domain-containing protein n=1 Tax=Lophiotrema nucula TaxID=690887 RepID=A0A6A5ZT48_9PLEO|nr:major facilitator superfamily domain-containing protein [Lophiotrema nucula]